MTDKNDQKTPAQTADVSLKQLASLTMPPNYQGLLNGIDDNIAAARRTIDQSLASSSELIRQSLATLTGDGGAGAVLNKPAPVESEADQEGSDAQSQSKSEHYSDKKMAASLSGEEQTQAYYEKLEAQQQAAQAEAEAEMAAAIHKTEQAITAGLEAQQQAQMELHQGLQNQAPHNNAQGNAQPSEAPATEAIPQDNYQQAQDEHGVNSVADAVSKDAMSNTPQPA